jgi:hypothetical protein
MVSTSEVPVDLTTEVVQVIEDGEPDDDGMPLAGRISPFAPSISTRTCACLCAPLPYALWELLDSLDAYAYDSRIWLRVLPEDFDEPLPEGATLIATKRVSYSVT